MKTSSQIKFDRIIKEGFHEILKPLGFRKKANNFYMQLDSIGQIVNIQKSMFGNKDRIDFTINTGIFVPQYWLAYYNFHNKELPAYPTEPECLIRKRIGEIQNKHDIWYQVNKHTKEDELILIMKDNLTQFILPYFDSLNNIDEVVEYMENEKMSDTPLGKLIIYAELNLIDKAKQEYTKLLKTKVNKYFLETVKEYGKKYQLD